MHTIKHLIEKITHVPLAAKASFSYIVCNIVQKSLSFITLPIFTRMLTVDQYGQCVLYASWSTLLTIFLTFNIGHGSFSRAMVKFEDDRDGYVSACQYLCIFLSAIFLIIFCILKGFICSIFDLPPFIIVIMVFEILGQSFIMLWSEKNKFEYKYKKVVVLTLIMSICSPTLAFVLIKNFTEKGFARIIGYAVPSIIIGIVLYVSNLFKSKKKWTKKYWDFIIGFNTPLMIYYLSQMIFNHSDKIIISKLLGNTEAALYGLAFTISMILTFILNAINGAYLPWMYRTIQNKEYKNNKRISLDIAILLALMLLCVIWFAPEIVLLFGGENYIRSIYCVPALTMSFMLIYYSRLIINTEFYFEDKKSIIISSLIPAIINIILNYIFIPMFGFVAASYTTLFSYIVFVLLNYLGYRKLYLIDNNIRELFDFPLLIVVAVLFFIIGFIGVFLYDLLVVRIVITLIVFVIFVIFLKKRLSLYSI